MANDINSVVLVGRLTKQQEIKFTTGGMAIMNFSLAVSKRVKKGSDWVDDVDFFDCKMFGKGAESDNNYLDKGKQVAIDGVLSQSRWEKEGQKHSKIEIIANTLQLLGGKSDTPQSTKGPQKQTAVPPEDFEDDIPF